MSHFQAFKCSIARIFATNDKVIGAGFLVSDRHLLTCAHVVAAALGLPSDQVEQPTGLVKFDMPLLQAGQRVSGKVVFWQPVNPGQLGEDVAVLEVDLGVLSMEARAVRLMVVDQPWGHLFRIFGFPQDRDDGIWASGVLREQQGAGWMQLEDLKAQGYAIEHGFSGAPIWDESLEAVVGMAVAADRQRTEAKAAFMIPVQTISQAWDGLAYVDLERILQPIESQFVRNLAVAYERTRPKDVVVATPKILSAQIKSLLDMRDEQGYSRLVWFVAYLVTDLESDESIDTSISSNLRDWGQQQTNNFANILQQVKRELKHVEKTDDQKSYLMIIVNAMTSEDRYQLSGWLIPDVEKYNMRTGNGAKSLVDQTNLDTEEFYSLQDIRSSFSRILDEACSLCESFTIEFFLPAKLLNQDLNFWEFTENTDIDDAEDVGTPVVSHQYPVILRSAARLKSDYLQRYRGNWQIKCQKAMEYRNSPASDLLVAGDDRHHDEIYKELLNATNIKFGIHLGKERLCYGKGSTFAALQKAGARK